MVSETGECVKGKVVRRPGALVSTSGGWFPFREHDFHPRKWFLDVVGEVDGNHPLPETGSL